MLRCAEKRGRAGKPGQFVMRRGQLHGQLILFGARPLCLFGGSAVSAHRLSHVRTAAHWLDLHLRTRWHKELCVEQTIFLHVCNDRMVVGEIIRSSCDHNIQSGKIREVMPQLEPFTCTLVPLTGTLYQELGSITMEPFTKKRNSAPLRSTPLSITAPAKGRQAALTTGQADTKLSCTQKFAFYLFC